MVRYLPTAPNLWHDRNMFTSLFSGLFQLRGLLGERQDSRAADRLFRAIVAQARQPWFYKEAHVPDTMAGRFDMITLHLFVVLKRLKSLDNTSLDRLLAERFMDELDITFREMGTGDMGVGPKVRKLARRFYNRLTRYGAAQQPDGPGMVSELHDIIFDGAPDHLCGARQLAAYVEQAQDHVTRLADTALVRGEISFPQPGCGQTARDQGQGPAEQKGEE